MNAILGGQFSSRINLNLRENKGFTYGATSAFLYYRESAFFEISTAVNIENSGQAVKEILKEIDGIRYSISENEIYFAKSYLIKQFPSQFETYPQIAKNIESLLIHSLDLNQLSLYTGRIEAASADEIRRAALENIFPDKMTVLIAGDRIKIREQLKSALNAEPTEVDLYGNPV
jgi:zinc protease